MNYGNITKHVKFPERNKILSLYEMVLCFILSKRKHILYYNPFIVSLIFKYRAIYLICILRDMVLKYVNLSKLAVSCCASDWNNVYKG